MRTWHGYFHELEPEFNILTEKTWWDSKIEEWVNLLDGLSQSPIPHRGCVTFHAIECDLLDVDHSEVARALKCGGERVVEPDAIGPALQRALAADGPYLIDVVIDPGARAPIVSLESPEDVVSH